MSLLQTQYTEELSRLEAKALEAAEAARRAELEKKKSPERLRLEELLSKLEDDRAFATTRGFKLEDRFDQIVLQGEHCMITAQVNCQKLQVSKLAIMTIIPGEKAKKKAAPTPASPLQFAMPVGDGDTQWVDTAEEASALIGRYLAQVTFRSDFNAVD